MEYPRIKVEGKGRSTVKLVEEAIRLAGRTIASRVYVVFDKDDFSDFDEAIRLAERHGIGVAWSNQSFEYWIYLHFNYIAAALGREDWVRKISQLLKDQKIREQGYQKNDPEVFTIATTYGSLKKAMANAEYAEKRFPPGTPPSKCDPCTTVHRLIGELRPYIEELMH